MNKTRGRAAVAAWGLLAGALLAGCGSSKPVADAGAAGGGGTTALLGPCNGDVSTDSALQQSLLPGVARVQARQQAADQFDGGFRVEGNAAEIGYIHYLAQQLQALGAKDVAVEPYTFTNWSAQTTALQVVQGPTPGPVNVAYYIPVSGSTGPNGVQAPLVYLSQLSDVNLLAAVENALYQSDPGDALLAVQSALDSATAGGISLAQAIAGANVSGKIVVYDAPRLPLDVGFFEAISVYYNNSSGSMGPTTPYQRPFADELLTIGAIDKALQQAGAVGVIAVLDYPPTAADNSYVPFGGLALPSVPGLYLDRDTGAALEQQIRNAGTTAPAVKLTLDAAQAQTTSYNVSGLIPGECSKQILVSSHSDGPNSLEDNGPAAILSIAGYFANAPVSQRKRGLKVVFTGGHFAGSPGIGAYITAHQAELSADVLTVIEMEHLGAREWLELSPGQMGLDGLPEPQVLYAGLGTVQEQENVKFAQQFDRSLVTPPLPFGEGGAWATQAGLPKTQFITGPVYLLNGPLPQVTSEFTDYELEQRQIAAFIQMILDFNTQTDAALLANQTTQVP